MTKFFTDKKYYRYYTYPNDTKNSILIRCDGLLLRNFILTISNYLIYLPQVSTFRRLIKIRTAMSRRMLPFVYSQNLFGKLDFYKDRKNFAILIVNLWKLFNKYLHIYEIDDQILFFNYMEFLVDFWILTDQIKTYRIYINSKITVFDPAIQALLAPYKLFSKFNIKRFLIIFPNQMELLQNSIYRDF